jgi:HTH-type transcriptional regulator/antitoxin HigA
MNFAQKHGVHPGIVVGQLQRRKEITYAHSRRMLVRVRGLITPSALTDGWRHMASV